VTLLFAMDRATVRQLDANGFLHVEVSNISKANVCPYSGREIPDWEMLGLNPDRIYQLLRDPEELAKAASTFNNLPILSEHVPVSSDDFPEELICGSTGSHAVFVAPYMQNSLSVWKRAQIDGIGTDRQKELSSAYRYRADMTPGETAGSRYDGVMRDIVGNHVALVIEGRAGPDVVVGDEHMKLKSRTALMVSGAIAAMVRPKLAKDARLDLSSALNTVSTKSLAMDGAPKALATKVAVAAKGKLAADADLDVEELVKVIEAVQAAPEDEDDIAEDEDKPADQREDESDEEYAARKKREQAAADKTAKDAEPDDKKKPAMDAATVRGMITDAEKRGAASVAAIDQAKRDVQPYVGAVVGMDSADAIYRFALDAAKVSYPATADQASLKAMVGMLPKASAVIAQDAATVTTHRSDFASRYPNAAKLRTI